MIESKNGIDADICKLFNVPVNMFDSSIPQDVWDAFIKLAIMPIINKLEKAINKALLSTEEQGKYYFAFNTKQLNKGDIEKRFKAYEIALKNGFMTPSEVRFEEDLNQIESGEIYTPNTNTTVTQNGTSVVQKGANNTNDVKGGEKDADRGEK